MCFDEMYSEHYYRKDTVLKFHEDADAMIVIGTALATNMAKNLVHKMLKREVPVIEVNMESSIDKGNNIQVLGDATVNLPKLFNELYKLRAAKKN